jgi:hypothetical protein
MEEAYRSDVCQLAERLVWLWVSHTCPLPFCPLHKP